MHAHGAQRGQGTMEYAILLGTLVVGAILTIASLAGRVGWVFGGRN